MDLDIMTEDLADHKAAHQMHEKMLDEDLKSSTSEVDITVRTPRSDSEGTRTESRTESRDGTDPNGGTFGWELGGVFVVYHLCAGEQDIFAVRSFFQ